MWITELADDAENGAWDHETGMPTVLYFSNALQVWSMAQQRSTTVGEAALAFNTTPEIIGQAVEAAAWMFLEGPADAPLRDRVIGHDGE